MKEIEKEYSNGEVTVVWKPHLCIHSTICFRGLPQVFQPGKRPWIKVKDASTQEIIDQVKKCPSGALSFFLNKPMADLEEGPQQLSGEKACVELFLDGPLMVEGPLLLKDTRGDTILKQESCYFCRCGASKNKPFCDGTHKDIDFKG